MPLNTIRSTIIEIYVDNANVKENIYACMHLLDLQTFGAWDILNYFNVALEKKWQIVSITVS